MNKWLFFGGLAFVLLMVLLGHNPAEERRKMKEARRGGADPLVHAIMEHNKESEKFGSRGASSGTRRYNTNMNTTRSMRGLNPKPSQYDLQQRSYDNEGGLGAARTTLPPHMMNNTPGAARATGPVGPSANDNYYPPAPSGTPPSELQLNQQQRLEQNYQQEMQQLQIDKSTPQSVIDEYYIQRKERLRQSMGITLRSGQKVEFAGSEVYTYDKKGNRVPMPDGIYPLMEGQVTMNIKNGRQIIISN